MRNMFSMNEGVTHGTQNHQIFSFIIFRIFINMMNSKNFLYLIISTFFTSLNNTSSFPKCTESIRIFRFQNMLIPSFICTWFGTIFSYFTWSVVKLFITQFTYRFVCPTVVNYSRFIITFSRTVLSFIASGRYVFESFIANSTICFNLFNISKFILACSRTVFKSFQTMNWHIARNATSNTIQKFSSMRFIRHATP